MALVLRHRNLSLRRRRLIQILKVIRNVHANRLFLRVGTERFQCIRSVCGRPENIVVCGDVDSRRMWSLFVMILGSVRPYKS